MLAQFGDEVRAGPLGMTHREVTVELVEPAAGAHAFDEHGQGTRWLRRKGDVRGHVLDAPAVTQRRGIPLLFGETFQQVGQSEAFLFDYPPTGFGVHRPDISQVS